MASTSLLLSGRVYRSYSSGDHLLIVHSSQTRKDGWSWRYDSIARYYHWLSTNHVLDRSSKGLSKAIITAPKWTGSINHTHIVDQSNQPQIITKGTIPLPYTPWKQMNGSHQTLPNILWHGSIQNRSSNLLGCRPFTWHPSRGIPPVIPRHSGSFFWHLTDHFLTSLFDFSLRV